ncbi:MAG: 16S rRNA methyltransferase [Thermoplasmatota archaeon]
MAPANKNERIPGPALTLLLVDSELELVPKEYWSHPAVVQNARKRKKKPSMVLLDSSLHHSIFRDKEEKNRRGRPDIVHQFLLLGLDSILNTQGRLSLFVHTRNDELVVVDPATRLPKNYNRYSGLFEELFNTGSVPAGSDPLIRLLRNMDLRSSVDHILSASPVGRDLTRIILLHPDGDRTESWEAFGQLIGHENAEHVICLVGGFSSGDLRSSLEGIPDRRIALPGGTLKVWTVVSELLVGFRAGITGSRTSEGA